MSGGRDPENALAQVMFGEMVQQGHSARRVRNDDEAATVRRLIRQLGRTARIALRTAQVDDTVLVARLDAAIWDDDPQLMRAKLTPP